MEERPLFSKRKTARLQNYSYTDANYYFITVCTYEKRCIFWQNGKMNQLGKIAAAEMETLQCHYPEIVVHQFIVMPNHIHAIISMGEQKETDKKVDLTQVVGSYKAGVSKKIHEFDPNLKVWQRSFHDHIIRNRAEYEKIWNYVVYNDQKWEEDCFYLAE